MSKLHAVKPMMGKLGILTFFLVIFGFYVAALLVCQNQIAHSEQRNKNNNYY
jgi:hypothetical protein